MSKKGLNFDGSAVEEHDVLQVVYLRLGQRCGYCRKKPKFIRAAQAKDGTLGLLTLCERHMQGASEHTRHQGMIPIDEENRTHFVNPRINEPGWVTIVDALRTMTQ